MAKSHLQVPTPNIDKELRYSTSDVLKKVARFRDFTKETLSSYAIYIPFSRETFKGKNGKDRTQRFYSEEAVRLLELMLIYHKDDGYRYPLKEAYERANEDLKNYGEHAITRLQQEKKTDYCLYVYFSRYRQNGLYVS